MAGISYELCFRKMLHVKAVYNAGQFGEKKNSSLHRMGHAENSRLSSLND